MQYAKKTKNAAKLSIEARTRGGRPKVDTLWKGGKGTLVRFKGDRGGGTMGKEAVERATKWASILKG